MLIFISNNFHLWIEELKNITLKIKIWKYINSNKIIKIFKKKHLFWRIFIRCFEYCSSRINICIYFHININKFIDVSKWKNANVLNSNFFIVLISKLENKISNVFSWIKHQSARKLQNNNKKISTTRKANIENHLKND